VYVEPPTSETITARVICDDVVRGGRRVWRAGAGCAVRVPLADTLAFFCPLHAVYPTCHGSWANSGNESRQYIDNLIIGDLLTAMTIEQQRSVLERLAGGELSPDEAEQHLMALADTEGAGRVPESTDHHQATVELPTVPHTTDEHNVVRATLNAAGLVEIAGDDAADAVRLEGPHGCTVSRNEEVTEVTGQVGDDTLLVVPSAAHLDLEVNAADATVSGLRGTLRGRFNVGHVTVAGAFTHGRSHIEANAGDLVVILEPGSDVRVAIRGGAAVDVDGQLRKVGRGEYTLSEGTALLDLAGHLGEIKIRALS
jgi:hypothetical protein